MLDGPDSSDIEITQRLRREKQDLEDRNRQLQQEADEARRDLERSVRTIENLRRQLSPLHRALRAVFGEIELGIGEEPAYAAPIAGVSATPAPAAGDQEDPRWQSYKNRFPGAPALIIDALLIHGAMAQSPLSKLIGIHYDTLRKAAAKLRDAGAVTVNGGMVSLKR